MHSQNLREYVDFLRRALPEEDRIMLSDAALERVAVGQPPQTGNFLSNSRE